jgi:hypothetical protein
MLALALGAPATAGAACDASANSCGIPQCWSDKVRLRPDLTRKIRISCYRATGATVKSAPQHSDLSGLKVDWSGIEFDARPHDDAGRYDEATFEVTGPEGSIELRVNFEVIPLSENSAPICDGARATRRSDGKGPVEVYVGPYCRDPDYDEFVMEGGGPGVHPYSPLSVPSGYGGPGWLYRTATFAGTETTKVWATDYLGARSADAELEVTVGPDIDRLPTCTPSSYGYTDVHPIRSRAGATRRFGIRCEDLDGDAIDARLSTPPERGAMPLFLQSQPFDGYYWGGERWVDATYVPTDDSLDPDPFTVTASGPRGDGPPNRFAITPVAPSENWGGGCGWSGGYFLVGAPGTLKASCDDAEGDPLTVEVVREPRHGTATPPVLTPGKFGYTDITVPYVPNPGYEGYDCVELRITDGHGSEHKIVIDINVAPAPPPFTPPDWQLPPLPPLPPIGVDLTPKEVKVMAQQILGTKDLKRVHSADGAQVWARSKLSRKELMRKGQAAGVVVVCSKKCKIRGDAVLANGDRVLRTSRRKTAASTSRGQPHVLALTLTPGDRKALGRAKKPQAKFNVTLRPAGGTTASLKRTIAFGK